MDKRTFTQVNGGVRCAKKRAKSAATSPKTEKKRDTNVAGDRAKKKKVNMKKDDSNEEEKHWLKDG